MPKKCLIVLFYPHSSLILLADRIMAFKLLRPKVGFWQQGPRKYASEQTKQNSLGYCVNLVKTRDYENYLASLLLPAGLHQPAFAIRAFNAEVASVKDSVSDRTIGLMRMQFWKNTIEDICQSSKAPPAHPVAQELDRAYKKFQFSKDLLLNLISSRERFLSNNPFQSLDEVDSYARDAFSSINFILLTCLNAENSPTSQTGHARHALNQLGMAQGVITLLRAVPYNAQQRQVLLPTDLMMSQGVSVESVVRKGDSEGLRLVIEATAARAQEHLDNTRFRMKFLSKEEKLLLLPAVGIDAYLAALHKADCNVFDSKLTVKNSWLPIQLYWHKFKGSY